MGLRRRRPYGSQVVEKNLSAYWSHDRTNSIAGFITGTRSSPSQNARNSHAAIAGFGIGTIERRDEPRFLGATHHTPAKGRPQFRRRSHGILVAQIAWWRWRAESDAGLGLS